MEANISLSLKNFTQLENFGHSLRAPSYRFRPTSVEEIKHVFRLARESGLTVAARGAGRSYNDAALNGGGIILDMSAMNQILEWDPASGVVRCDPGVTLEQLWQCVEPDGWWPPVVSGTMKTTLGGCLSANIHGKNNFKMGPIGEHVVEFTALLPTGVEITCTPKKNSDLFYSMISGLGMLGVFTSITMQMKHIESGLLEVHAWPVHDLHEHLSFLFDKAPNYDYVVGWMDTMNGGKSL
ncbi:MAG TPA: FAD-binding oxidoreductase, partial [Anaerolineales bacterium]